MIEQIYSRDWQNPSDINEHLPTLRELASYCSDITEMGCWRGLSSFSLACGLMDAHHRDGSEGRLTVYDFNRAYLEDVEKKLEAFKEFTEPGIIDIRCRVGDTREIEIDETDLLFIDSWHTYTQLNIELQRHGNKARKYLAFHDVVSFGFVGEDGESPGLQQAIDDFMEENPHWVEYARYENNNGLLILERV